MPDCRNCPHSDTIPGDAHIMCGHPSIVQGAFKIMTIVQIGQGEKLRPLLGFGFNQRGVDSGWCTFPMNYDPIWLDGECNIKALQEQEDAKKENDDGEVSKG